MRGGWPSLVPSPTSRRSRSSKQLMVAFGLPEKAPSDHFRSPGRSGEHAERPGFQRFREWSQPGSNRRPPACKVDTAGAHCLPYVAVGRKHAVFDVRDRSHVAVVCRKCLLPAFSLVLFGSVYRCVVNIGTIKDMAAGGVKCIAPAATNASTRSLRLAAARARTESQARCRRR
jgi:hypothetical protein